MSAGHGILRTSRHGAPAFSLVGPDHAELLLMPCTSKGEWLRAVTTMERLCQWLNRGGAAAERARKEMGL